MNYRKVTIPLRLDPETLARLRALQPKLARVLGREGGYTPPPVPLAALLRRAVEIGLTELEGMVPGGQH